MSDPALRHAVNMGTKNPGPELNSCSVTVLCRVEQGIFQTILSGPVFSLQLSVSDLMLPLHQEYNGQHVLSSTCVQSLTTGYPEGDHDQHCPKTQNGGLRVRISDQALKKELNPY